MLAMFFREVFSENSQAVEEDRREDLDKNEEDGLICRELEEKR